MADPKHCTSNPPASIRSHSESCIDSLSSMMAINLDVWPPGVSQIQYRLMSHLYTRLFIARAAGCKWNRGDFAVKWE